MDIGTILKGVGIAKDFLGGDSGEGSQSRSALEIDLRNSRRDRIGRYTMNTDSAGNRLMSELAPPGQASQIQQVSYKDTQRFWDNYLTEYMRG